MQRFERPVPGSIREHVPLHERTSLRVGGPARYFAEPDSQEDVVAVLGWVARARIPLVVLGAGTNVLFSDDGYSGLVLSVRGLRGLRIEGEHITAAGGEPLPRVAWTACQAGLTGLEWACGIPGTIGGAVAMNAGAHGGDIASVLSSATLATEEGRRDVPADALGLGYRTSALLEGARRGVVVEAVLNLEKTDAEGCLALAHAHIAERVGRLPIGASAGSVFRNPSEGPTAGELLDQAGCKGLRIGQARVSCEHANVIVNDGAKNACDIASLIETMRERVQRACGIELRAEVVIHQ